MAWLAILIAAAVGYAVTVGLKGHMEKEPDKGPPPPAPDKPIFPPDRAHECLAILEKLPHDSNPSKDLQRAAKVAYLYGRPDDADEVKILANHLTSLGYTDAGVCLREKSNELRAAKPAVVVPTFPTLPIFPT